MALVINWLIATFAIIVTAYLLPGVTVSGIGAALIAALVLGIINVFIKPILLALSLPINIFTLGLFTFVINALLVLLTSAVVPGLLGENFCCAVWAWAWLTILLAARQTKNMGVVNNMWSAPENFSARNPGTTAEVSKKK